MFGRKEQVRFYVDGMPAAEKQETHTERDQTRQKALIKTDIALSNLESRLIARRRVRKHRLSCASKYLRQAFHWSLEHRPTFAEYISNKDYDIVLCPTEADVFIAAECQPQDGVLSCDNDMIFYCIILVLWRPVGSYKSRRFIPCPKSIVLNTLVLPPTQLTAHAILSGNDYVSNIPHLAFETSLKITKGMKEASHSRAPTNFCC
ncbi:hypothetical protein BGZ47_000341, partial [Haplosporangium gracile]